MSGLEQRLHDAPKIRLLKLVAAALKKFEKKRINRAEMSVSYNQELCCRLVPFPPFYLIQTARPNLGMPGTDILSPGICFNSHDQIWWS